MAEYAVEEPSDRSASWRVRERIVRCRDCKYYEPNTYSHFTCELLTFHVDPDGFCAWGERREDA